APYTADLQWNRVSNLEPSGPKVETLPLGHRGPLRRTKYATAGNSQRKSSNDYRAAECVSGTSLVPLKQVNYNSSNMFSLGVSKLSLSK
ncbi:hypothetical protein AVEN_164692-1, partial [Araneus ventricosus]